MNLTISAQAAKTTCSNRSTVRVLPATSAATVAPLWQDIEVRLGRSSLVCSWVWTETWLRHYGDLVPHRFVVGMRHGTPYAAALVTVGIGRRRGPFPIRTLHLGTAGEPDDETVRVQHNRLLVDPGDRQAFVGDLLNALATSDLRWDELALDGFTPDEIAPFAQAVPSIQTQANTCYVTDLKAIREGDGHLLNALRRHTAAKIRRTTRRLEEEWGPIRVHWAETVEDAMEVFEELRNLHQARWTQAGKAGAFASARFTAFHRDLIRQLHPLGRILLIRVTAGDCTVGCDYGLIDGGRVLSYQWGIRRFEDSRLSPGLMIGALSMQAALERGLDEFDWLAGDVLYKRELSTGQRRLIWASAPFSAKMHAINALVHLRNTAHALRVAVPRSLSLVRGTRGRAVVGNIGWDQVLWAALFPFPLTFV